MNEDKKKVADEIIDSLLNFALNRHIHILVKKGYLDREKYDRDYGYDGDIPKDALKIKWDLISEVQSKFSEPLSNKLISQPDTSQPKHGG